MRRGSAVYFVVTMVVVLLVLIFKSGWREAARAQVVGPVPTTTTFEFDDVRGVIGTLRFAES